MEMNDIPKIIVKGLASSYEIEHLARIFIPEAMVSTQKSTKGTIVYANASAKRLVVGIRLRRNRCLVIDKKIEAGQPKKLELAYLLYHLFLKAGFTAPPWGMLTGVRPVHLLRKTQAAHDAVYAKEYFLQTYGVTPQKYNLIAEIVERQKAAIAACNKNSYSLYVSIPFCPSRCSYCSFISRSIERDAALVDDYIQLLDKELVATAKIAQKHNLKLETIYVGGGTPTALNEAQLEALLQSIEQSFATDTVKEYTVEAGRPDCTSYEKLLLLKKYGVSRISINPQTLDDKVLANIGRKHTGADILRCYEDARKAGHANINMDLIAGLPGETPEGFEKTLQQIIALKPENITVHTLTLKRASNIVIENRNVESLPGKMIQLAYPLLEAAGYLPYYLYRQKNTADNLENTGWALPQKQGLYNIFIMEEVHSILAVGAGASIKMIEPETRLIKRVFNFKYPVDYIGDFQQVLDKKRGVSDFYASYLDTETIG